MSYTAENWPITAALLQFPGARADGTSVQDAPAAEWQRVFEEVADAGFANADLTDSWVRPGTSARRGSTNSPLPPGTPESACRLSRPSAEA